MMGKELSSVPNVDLRLVKDNFAPTAVKDCKHEK